MKKISKADQNREIARALYVSGKSLQEIADILDVNVRTIQNYQSKDTSLGNDWNVRRAEKHMMREGPRREYLYSDFIAYMYDTLKDIREDEAMPAGEKTDKIVKLSDAFSKMKSIARHEDPEAYKRGVIKHVVQTLGVAIKEHHPEFLDKYIELTETVQDDLDVDI